MFSLVAITSGTDGGGALQPPLGSLLDLVASVPSTEERLAALEAAVVQLQGSASAASWASGAEPFAYAFVLIAGSFVTGSVIGSIMKVIRST